MATQKSYLIVGAGVFGASTALYMKESQPSANVTLLDKTPFPNPSAASHDLNKIIRSDYDDIFYMKLALESHELWRTDPIYKPFYHESGMFFNENWGMSRDVMKNYQILGIDHGAKMVSPTDVKASFDGLFKDVDLADIEQSMWNPTAGWGEADHALKSLIQAAVDRGVIYTTATVSTLKFSQDGGCTGVNLEDGKELLADHTILCTGALTAKLIADSAPDNKELQVNGRMVAAGAITCCANFAPEETERLNKASVIFVGNHTHGESIPPTPGGLLKFNYELSFTNMTYHEASEQTISIPPTALSQKTWSQDVPEGLKKDAQKVVKNIYGNQIKGLKIESYRMCWDAVTPNQDWIISPHPKCKNLYLAGGGSFHSWKFMPTVGKYVVQMVHGILDEEKTSRWAWDRGEEGAACVMYIPARDLKDVEGYANLTGHVNGHIDGNSNGH